MCLFHDFGLHGWHGIKAISWSPRHKRAISDWMLQPRPPPYFFVLKIIFLKENFIYFFNIFIKKVFLKKHIYYFNRRLYLKSWKRGGCHWCFRRVHQEIVMKSWLAGAGSPYLSWNYSMRGRVMTSLAWWASPVLNLIQY